MVGVTSVKLLGDFCLQLGFSNGRVKKVDFTQHWSKLWGVIFQPLHDPHFFAQVTLPPDSETIEWPNGADLAAEFLYEIGEPVMDKQFASPVFVAAGIK